MEKIYDIEKNYPHLYREISYIVECFFEDNRHNELDSLYFNELPSSYRKDAIAALIYDLNEDEFSELIANHPEFTTELMVLLCKIIKNTVIADNASTPVKKSIIDEMGKIYEKSLNEIVNSIFNERLYRNSEARFSYEGDGKYQYV